jgi:hypothetical protein
MDEVRTLAERRDAGAFALMCSARTAFGGGDRNIISKIIFWIFDLIWYRYKNQNYFFGF